MKVHAAILSFIMLLACTTNAMAQTPEPKPGDVELQVNGSFIDSKNGQGAFSGDIDLSRFRADVQSGAIVLLGMLTGSLADSAGNPLGHADQEVVLPVTVVQSTCELLHLEFGPVDVDMLGTRVRLQKITIGITRRYGAEPQFGNLLCSTARLLGTRPRVDAAAGALNTLLQMMELPKYYRPSRQA